MQLHSPNGQGVYPAKFPKSGWAFGCRPIIARQAVRRRFETGSRGEYKAIRAQCH